MRKTLSFFVMMGLSFLCNAAPAVKRPFVPSQDIISRPFDSMNEAATYAAKNAYELTRKFESGALILYNTKTGKYAYEGLHTNENIGHIQIEHDIAFPAPWIIVAQFHTHPCYPISYYTSFFSDADTSSSIYYQQPTYMGELCTGLVHKFDPATDLPGDGPQGDLTEGRIIGRIDIYKHPVLQEMTINTDD